MQRTEESTCRPSGEDDFFDVLFDRIGNPARSFRMEGGIGWRPATNVWETDEELVVQADLAGLQRAAIEVWIDQRRLLMRGTRPDPSRGGSTHFHKLEIPSGPFERWIALPENIDPANASARYENGFLLVRIPFGEEEPEGRHNIRIQT